MSAIRAVAVVNNSISADLLREDLVELGISLEETAVILLRDLGGDALCGSAVTVRYPGRPAQGLIDQRRFIAFYYRAVRLLRRVEHAGNLRHVFIVNNDNLITSHLLAMAGHDRSIAVSVVVEGLMNFQEISIANRAGWRWRVKPLVAAMLGYRYREPVGHLSGAFEPEVSRVVSFAGHGLKAPQERVVLRPFPQISPQRRADPSVALVALTGLVEWMPAERFEPFAHAFVAWIRASGFRKIQIKRHPRVSAGLIEDLLADAEEVGQGQPLEAMAADLEAGTILGTCCTALVTLRLIRPDLECIDFGSDYYCEYAYGGDTGVTQLLSAAGVRLVQIDGALVEKEPARCST